MNNIEEKLWNYIDGTSTPEEHEAITLLIEQDEAYRQKYRELLLLNSEFAAIELDEPPMAFTYNVMETIRNEYAKQPLKASINMRIIKGIGLFFVLTISVMLIYVFSSIHCSAGGETPLKFTMPDISHHLTSPLMQGFCFFDIVLALYLLDNYLRKKSVTKLHISVQSGGQKKQ